MIVNAGIGKGAWPRRANKANLHRNQPGRRYCRSKMALGHAQTSAVRGIWRSLPQCSRRQRMPASKPRKRQQSRCALRRTLRAEYAQRPIRVTVLEPGYIESEMTAKSASTMLMVDTASRRWWPPSSEPDAPWSPRAAGATGAVDKSAAAADQTLSPAGASATSPRGHVRCGSGAPARRSSCPTAVAVNRRR